MISKINRFHGHNSLNPVYKHGQSVSESQISLKYLPTRPGKKYRLSVVVSRKVNKSAVVRNRIRRRIYENMRLKEGSLVNPNDIVVNVYSDQAATMGANELDNILNELLTKAQLLSVAKGSGHDIVNGKGN